MSDQKGRSRGSVTTVRARKDVEARSEEEANDVYVVTAEEDAVEHGENEEDIVGDLLQTSEDAKREEETRT